MTDQPAFLNAAAIVQTRLTPTELLHELKRIEGELGRNFHGQRWGPRPIDLDIIFYEDINVNWDDASDKESHLTIPHPRWQERNFVIAPLSDLVHPNDVSSGIKVGLDRRLRLARRLWEAAGGERMLGGPDLYCVMPMGRLGLWSWQRNGTKVMGILNVTPDSFSDGGQHFSVAAAVEHAKLMVSQGADIIDIGGQSTRPGALRLTPDEEADRILPIIKALSSEPMTAMIPLSVDTFYSSVAQAAIEAGATMINDVSGGSLDEDMLRTVSEAEGIPYVAMHMRGSPQTMQNPENIIYHDICSQVAESLKNKGNRAMTEGIEPWRLILDPGLGFAKTVDGNLQLIAGLDKLRRELPQHLYGLPILVGPSRKGFLGSVTGRTNAQDRDWATASAAAFCVLGGASIVRAHNVTAVKDAVRVADAIIQQSKR